MLLCENDFITIEDLPESITECGQISLREMSQGRWDFPEEWLQKSLKDARKDILQQLERGYLTSLLTSTGGRVGEAAKKAGIDTRSLYDKMKQYGLNKKDFRPEVQKH
jgi:DNA-binding NtrC family response regulator